MRIILFSSNYYPILGGIAPHIHNLGIYLQKIGHEVSVINSYLVKENEHHDIENGLLVHRIYSKYPLRFLNISVRAIKILILILRIRPDIIHFHNFIGLDNFIAHLVSRRYACVFTNHTSTYLKMFDNPNFRVKLIRYLKPFHGVIGVSPELFEKSKIIDDRTYIYIPNGVDIEQFHPFDQTQALQFRSELSIPENSVVITLPRRWVHKNGIDVFIRALIYMMNNRLFTSPITAIFCGNEYCTDPAYGQLLQALLSQISTDQITIKLLGNISTAEMPRIYAVSDIVVLPSRMEAVSIAGLEAMACGKALIGAAVGGIPEIVIPEKTGELFPCEDHKALANAIAKLSGDRQCRLAYGHNGRELVMNEYAWPAITSKTEKFYNKIISERTNRVTQ